MAASWLQLGDDSKWYPHNHQQQVPSYRLPCFVWRDYDSIAIFIIVGHEMMELKFHKYKL